MTARFYSVDRDGDRQQHDTEADARGAVQDALDEIRTDIHRSGEGWPEEELAHLAWGVELGHVVETNRAPNYCDGCGISPGAVHTPDCWDDEDSDGVEPTTYDPDHFETADYGLVDHDITPDAVDQMVAMLESSPDIAAQVFARMGVASIGGAK